MAASWKVITFKNAQQGTSADWEVASGGNFGAIYTTIWDVANVPPHVDQNQPAVFSIQINVPSVGTPEGCVWEVGGNPRGGYLVFNGSGDLVWRVGQGDLAGQKVTVPYADIPKDQTITIVTQTNFLWFGAESVLVPGDNIVRESEIARIWVNLKQYRSSPDLQPGAGQKTNWANGGGASSGQVNGKSGRISTGETGNYDQEVTISGVTFVTGLRYWRNTIVEQPAENFDTINVIQENEATRHAAWLNTGARRIPWLHTGTLPINWSSSEVIAKERVAWDHNRIADVKFEDDAEAQVVYDHNREAVVLQAEEDEALVTQVNEKTCSVLWLDSQEAKVVF